MITLVTTCCLSCKVLQTAKNSSQMTEKNSCKFYHILYLFRLHSVGDSKILTHFITDFSFMQAHNLNDNLLLILSIYEYHFASSIIYLKFHPFPNPFIPFTHSLKLLLHL